MRNNVELKTDPDARLYKRARADKAIPSYQGHALMENRNGLLVAAEVSLAATMAERELALKLLDQVIGLRQQRKGKKITLGADTQCQEAEVIRGLRKRKVAPHVNEYGVSNLGENSLTVKERADERCTISQSKRKLIERVFGWSKLTGPPR